jgi:DNA polymerase-3 subunit delta'
MPSMGNGFQHIRGHAHQLQTLRQAMDAGMVAHAYLFSGPSGVGKELVARMFFSGLLCESGPGEPCGQCGACGKVERGTHADLVVLEPEGKFIKIGQVRHVTSMVHYPPLEGRYRCILIKDAEQLHEAAGNALLKTLEEPSSHTVFILLSSRPHLVLSTIVSRCQGLAFSGLIHNDVVDVLVGAHGISPADAESAAGMAGGRVDAALEILDSDLIVKRNAWLDCLVGLPETSGADVFALAEKMTAEKGMFEPHLAWTMSWYRDLLVAASGGERDVLENQDRAEQLCGIAQHDDIPALLQSLEGIEKVFSDRRFNVNPRLAAEHLILHLTRPIGGRAR